MEKGGGKYFLVTWKKVCIFANCNMGIAHDTLPRQCTNRQNKTIAMLTDQDRLVAAVKEKVDQWLAENAE